MLKRISLIILFHALIIVACLNFNPDTQTERKPANELLSHVQQGESGSRAARTQAIKEVVTYFSSPELGGRAANSPGRILARDYLVSKMKSLGYETQIETSLMTIPWKGKIENVIAKKAGKVPNGKCIAWVAHYDHNPHMAGQYSPGANDNASGVAALIELAKMVQNFETNDDLYFLFPDKEENFILGSKPLARWLTTQCKKVEFTVTLDMVGASFFPGFENHLLALGAESSADLADLIQRTSLEGLTVKNAAIYLIELLGIPRSDYTNFREQDIPFVFLTAGMPYHYHTPLDSVDKVDFSLVEKTTEYLWSMLQHYKNELAGAAFDFDGSAKGKEEVQIENVAYLIERLKSKAQENQLSAEDIVDLDQTVQKLRDPKTKLKRQHLQFAVIKVLKIVGRKNPIPGAYLRSVLRKVF